MGKKPICALVAIIFLACGPAHVVGKITCLILNTFYAVAWPWTLADISQKSDKISAPFLADRDAAPTIVLETLDIGIVAALNHGPPNTVFRRAPSSARGSMNCQAFGGCFAFATTATFRITTAKRRSANVARLAALTEAMPKFEGSSLAAGFETILGKSQVQDGPAPKSLPGEIENSAHSESVQILLLA